MKIAYPKPAEFQRPGHPNARQTSQPRTHVGSSSTEGIPDGGGAGSISLSPRMQGRKLGLIENPQLGRMGTVGTVRA